MAKTAVILLSGGLDSATCLAIAAREGSVCHCLSFAYGQRHALEVGAARRIAASMPDAVVSHRIIEIDLGIFGGSALTDPHIAVPKSALLAAPPALKSQEASRGGDPSSIPPTYVPARNTIFLSYALALAEVTESSAIFVGVNAVDYSGYPDCRPEYVDAFQRMADMATRAGVEGHGPRIVAPLLHLSKAEIIRLGMELGVDYSLTHSCYDPDESGAPCARCESCRIRAAAFAEVGMRDPGFGGRGPGDGV